MSIVLDFLFLGAIPKCTTGYKSQKQINVKGISVIKLINSSREWDIQAEKWFFRYNTPTGDTRVCKE